MNVPPAVNIIYSNQNEFQQIQSKIKHSSKNNSKNLNLSNDIKDNIDSKSQSQSQSINVSAEIEDDNFLLKRSTSYKLGESIVSYKINNFNDIPSNKLKKSRTYKEEATNGLYFPYSIYNNQQNHCAAVLETINEVVSSRVDSSELSDDDENKDANKNNKNDDNDKDKGDTNYINNKKEDIYDKQINESDTAFATKK